MRKPISQWNAFRVGLAAFVVFGLLGLGILALGQASFGTNSYTAHLAQTGGLRVSESVKVHGVSVGEVKKVELADTYVTVEFVLDDDIELGPDTEATVKVGTLLGTHYLEVTPRGTGALPDGTIALERTSTPFNLEDVIEEGTAALNELQGEEIAKALTAMSDTLTAAGDEVGPVLQGVGRLSDVVAKRSGQMGDLARAVTRVSDQLTANSADIVSLMEQSNLVISEITARREAIRRLLRETTALSESLTAIVNETKGDLRPALKNVNIALRALNRERRTLQQVLTRMAPAVRYIANATGSGPWVDLYLDDPVLPADDARNGGTPCIGTC